MIFSGDLWRSYVFLKVMIFPGDCGGAMFLVLFCCCVSEGFDYKREASCYWCLEFVAQSTLHR